MNKPILLAAALIVVIVGGAIGYFYWNQSHPSDATEEAAQTLPPEGPANAEPAVRNPIPETAPDSDLASTPLPTLADSDMAMHDALAGIVGPASVDTFLEPQNVIRKVVATVDNLTRKKAPVQMRPIKVTPGMPVIGGDEDNPTLGEESFARYAPLVRVVQATSTKSLAALYVRFYPLFQQAYEDLGYPDKYFNDRLIEVIDDLLAAPDVQAPIELTRPNVFYEYKDPELEALSAGQKTLIRMGPKNAAAIKAKLRELRAEVATGAR